MPISHALFNSCVQVYRLTETPVNGRPQTAWVPQASPLDRVYCRLDLTFVRPGKDQPPAYEAGKAPDRVGVLFCDSTAGLLAGDLIVAVPNDYGMIPLPGTFEIRVIPDQAQDYMGAHHIEVQIIETSQKLVGVFPGSE